MAGFGNFPTCGPCCGATCTIFSDDYSSDQLATAYTTSSGSWTVSSGVLTTGSAGALLTETAAGSAGHGQAQVSGKADTSGGKFRVRGAVVDDNNYVFAEVTVNGASSTLKLWKRVSGTDTQLATATFTLSTGTYYRIAVCWTGVNAIAYINFSNSSVIGPGSADVTIGVAYTGTGNQAGLGASPNGGTVTFDDFSFTKTYAEDSTCFECGGACGNCSGGVGPRQLQVDVAGVNSAYDGTYILTLNYNPTCTTCAPCCYGVVSSIVCAGLNGLCEVLCSIEASRITVTLVQGNGLSVAFILSASGQNCLTFSALDIPYFATSIIALLCKPGASPTCAITSIA